MRILHDEKLNQGISTVFKWVKGVFCMLWSEVREMYPDQYVVLQALSYHTEEDKKIMDEVVLIKTIDSLREATRELVRSSGDWFVYHTTK